MVEHTIQSKGKGKKKQIVQAAQYDSSRITNLDLLQKLGFNKNLIAENRRLGLKERDMTSDFHQYLAQHRRDLEDGNVIIDRP